MPTLSGADSDSDSALELSDLSDSAAAAGSGGNGSPAEEQEGEEDEEVVEEEEGEEGVEEEEMDGEGDEDEGVEEEEEMEEAVVEEEEVVEEMEEAVVEDEGEEEVEDGDGDEDGEEEGADLLNEAEDTNMNIESEEPGEGLETVSSTPERSKSNSPAVRHARDGIDGNLTAYNPSDDTDSGSQMEKGTPALARDDARDTHGSRSHLVPENARDDNGSQSHLVSGDSVNAEDATLAWRNEIPVVNKAANSDGGVKKEANDLHTKTNLQTPEDFGLSSMQTPQRRPRSSSPGDTLESLNKKPAIICDFFARGWCIKGSSCRFLHQKEEAISTSQQMEENIAGSSRKGEYLGDAGFQEEAERSKRSASRELLNSSHIESSSKSPFLLQRALVRAYGESHELPKIHGNYNILGAENVRRGHYRVDVQQSAIQTLTREEYKGPFGLRSHPDIVNERHLADNDPLPIRYQNERKLLQEIPREESLIGSPFLRGSSLAKSTLLPEFRSHSGGQPTASNVYPNNIDPLAYDKRTDGHYIWNQQTHVPPLEHGLSSFRSSSLNNPLNSFQFSSSTRGSTLLSAEQFDAHKVSEFDKGNYDSRSASLPKNFSPYYSEIATQQNTPRDFLPSTGQKTQLQASWEPSVPFRPSFIGLPTSGSQYDPLLDSIDRPNAGNSTFQTPQRANVHNASSQHINGNPSLSSHTPGYNAENPLNSFSQSHEGILGKNTAQHGPSGYSTLNSFSQSHEGILGKSTAQHGPSGYSNVMVAASRPDILGGNSSMTKEEKHHIASYMVEDVNVNAVDPIGNAVDPIGNLRNLDDKGKNNKEPKALKFFRAALIDFIKELMKPSWREGHLSKDVHKMIVKKAVEKVLSALQLHQIPPTVELVNQYLSTSRPKLLKLVEGYVEKYSKS